MSSGIKISDDVKETWSQISMNTKTSKKLKYAVFKFSSDNKEIEVERKGEASECPDYDCLISELPDDDVRYIAYDFDFIAKTGAPKSEVLLISWHPETASVKKKMLCASSLVALKTALNASKVIEGDAFAEVDCNACLKKVGGSALCQQKKE